jgi:hypothetical protein
MTPELQTIVWVEGLDRRRAKEIAVASEQRDVLRLNAEHRGLRGPWWLTIPELQGLLAHEADGNAVTWAMEPDGLERLATTLEWLYSELPEEFTFEATGGEEPIEKLVSRDELLRVVRAGRVGTRARYRVPSGWAKETGPPKRPRQ